MKAKRLRIEGRVQGVGYRQWMAATAARLGVEGWVRNHPDGMVEALIQGEADAVEEMQRLCRRGPPGAAVALLHETLVEPEPWEGFVIRR